METKGPRIIYKARDYSFFEELFILRGGRKKSFYFVLAGQSYHWLSEEEGKSLEGEVAKSHAMFDCEGVELTLSEFSSCRQSEHVH